MKYLIVIADGSADHPQEALGGKTPLAAARIPNMDRVAAGGRTGLVRTVPDGFTPGSDVAMMSILGYSPAEYYTGRAPLEAAGLGIELAEGDWAARCNFVTISDGKMADFSAGHISSDEGAALIATLDAELGGEGVEFVAGKSYRNLLVMRGVGKLDIATTPPHDISGRRIAGYLPHGGSADVFLRLMEKSRDVLMRHEVNRLRREAGKGEATSIWLWGEGPSTRLEPFESVFGLRAAVITAVDLVGGVSALVGWERIEVPGATGYYDTDYAGKAAAALGAIEEFDLIMVHVEAPDEASHNRDLANKIACVEKIDSAVVGPLLEAVGKRPARLMVLSDHYTLVETGAHEGSAVPFAIFGDGVEPDGGDVFTEAACGKGVRLDDGPELMRLFVGS